MLVFIDLDGTLTNTTHPSWQPYRDGKAQIDVNTVPVFPGAYEFIQTCFNRGIHLVLVSDSHPKYVGPIQQKLGLQGISLADKPNTQKLDGYIAISPILQEELRHPENCYFIGDTKLDIEIGRKMKLRTILLQLYSVPDGDVDQKNGIGDRMGNFKMGPTYCAYSYEDILRILEHPEEHLYALEAKFVGSQSTNVIRFWEHSYSYDTRTAIFCLARQEEGLCDKYARSDKYREISNPNRSQEFIDLLARTLSEYLLFFNLHVPQVFSGLI